LDNEKQSHNPFTSSHYSAWNPAIINPWQGTRPDIVVFLSKENQQKILPFLNDSIQ
jgi:hypothetical protein